ncbi:Rne/Rng family ribonuclease [Alcaligenaceae bacterium]|nr:Rne/Rng family ribonuclease [Alcaligenaceae bacterium]
MKRMLFNATHQEELRVAIVDGQKLIDLDIETAGREQRKGNIYKGIITRIEPGLEACFVSYGEERHGFLPFKEVARSYFKEGIDVRAARIQDALVEGQELIIQVEKEERGNKGAALTTFISLAGRYLVLMPNNPRGGGVSRRVEGEDRQELRDTMDQLDLPAGMSIIARTAGIGRNVEELQWDLSYLMQLWNAIDGAARENAAPILIYLESSLVIRAIRDYYSPEIGEILIDTDEIYEQAAAFMGVVMPDNVQRVKMYRDDIPLFSRFQIEHQIETAYSRTVQLPSGGSVVIDHTEALVAIDVNSARSTRGSDIEETALRTNLEAADEVARQLRLRDLGGLIVIDFIDMEDNKNQRAVEQRLRDALRFDRARVQMGKISRFGLMELSRQRLRPALNEGSHITCPRCTGTGVVRDAESSALQVLRLLQEEAMKEGTAALHAQVPVDVATFLLNEKRSDITKIESRLKVNLVLIPNKNLETPHHHIERLRHDDPRLEEIKTSFELVQAADQQLTWAPNRAQEAKTQPEALVKGITPSQPAPIHTPSPKAAAPAKAAASGPGLIKRLINWLTGAGAAAQPEPVAASKPQGNNRGRNSRHQEHRERNQNDRNRQRRGPRAEAAEGKEDGTPNRGRRNQQATNNASDAARTAPATLPEANVADTAENRNASRGGRNRRGRGRQRSEEASIDLNTDTQAATAAVTPETEAPAETSARKSRHTAIADAQANELIADIDGVDTQVDTGTDNDQLDPERKRRRRRSRRGRRNTETLLESSANADDSSDDNQDNTPAFVAHETPVFNPDVLPPISVADGDAEPAVAATAVAATTVTAVATIAATPVETTPVVEQAPAVVEPAVVEPVAAEPVAVAVAEEVTTVTTVLPVAEETQAVVVVETTPAVETPVVEAIAVVEATPVIETQPAAPTAVEVETEVKAVAEIAPEAAVAPEPTVKPTNGAVPATAIELPVGMELIETRHHAVVEQPQAQVQLGRRRKPAAVIADEPLKQVETQ